MRQLVHIRLETDILDRVRLEADRQDISVAEFVRRSVEKALSPGSTSTPADPILQAMVNGIRREAASRQLSPEMIVQLWFQMMRPGLPMPESAADALRLNKTATPKPEKPKP